MRSLFRYYIRVIKVTEFKSGCLATLAAKWRKRAVHANPILFSYGERGGVSIIHYINTKKNVRVPFVWDRRGFASRKDGIRSHTTVLETENSHK